MSRILIIDDDPDFSGFLREALEAHLHQVDYADSAVIGLETLAVGEFDIILLDNRMPGMSGLEALGEFRTRGIDLPVIMMTSQGTSEIEIQAWIQGVFEYVEKLLDIEELVEELEPLIDKITDIIPPPSDPSPDVHASEHQLLGTSPAMKSVLRLIAQAAPSDVPVLIHGESGTGKELVARAIHDHSSRKDGPFVAINVSALTESLLESELFGYEKGAFTGADRLRKGYFEFATGGTLFLDEIGEMPLPLQARLLRVVQEEGTQEVRRLGSDDTPIKVDVRLVCATNRDLIAETKKKTFREDLYFRLATFPIELPPLRERGSDLALLGRHFRIRAAQNANRPVPTLAPSAVAALRGYSWPGNVRELRNVLTRAVLKCQGYEILPEHLGLPTDDDNGTDGGADFGSIAQQAWQSGEPNLHQLLHDALDRNLLEHALTQCDGNQTQLAERLGLSRNTVRKLVLKYGLK